MAIEFLCSNAECGIRLEVGDELAGKKVRCPKCKTVSVAQGNEQTSKKANEQKGGGVESLESILDETSPAARRYVMGRELARGGMGAIILARDKAIQRELAVKVMRAQIADSEEHRLRFLEEAQVTGQLEHPNIVPIHELGKDAEGNLYFTMKLVKGRSLGEILKDLKTTDNRPQTTDRGRKTKDRPSGEGAEGEAPDSSLVTHHWSLAELLGAFLKVCDGIAFAHSKGVIHRDLKPDNIMVGEFGEVQIMDWGLAKVLRTDLSPQTLDLRPEEEGTSDQSSVTGEGRAESEIRSPESAIRNQSESAIRRADTVRSVRSESDVALTVDGQITGTPAYMPPEQAEGKLELIDHRSDVHSLGAILYEVLTLERPIEGDTVHKVLLNVSDGKITPPEQRTPGRFIPKELSAVVMKAMARNRRKRYQSVQGLGQDIKLFLEGRSVSAKEDTFVESVGKLIKRNKGISAAIGIAVVLVLTIGTVFTIDNTKRRLEAESARDDAVSAREEQRATAEKASRELAEYAVRAAEEHRFEQAEVQADAAVRVMPEGPWGHYAQAMIARERKDFEGTGRLLRKALEAEPSHAPSKAALSGLLSAQGDVAEAAKLLENLDEIIDWKALLAAGKTFLAAGGWSDAEQVCGKAVSLMEKDEAISAEKLEEAKYQHGKARAERACEGFYNSIKDLPTGEQAKRLTAKFSEIHDAPVRLREVGTADGKLERLVLHNERHVRWLQPLRGLQLSSVDLTATLVADITPLRGMPLRDLVLISTRVSSLEALRGMPLQELHVMSSELTDLSPVEGMPLTKLTVGNKVRDLTPLAGMSLTFLYLNDTAVKDISPLRGMPLKEVNLTYSMVTDLGPLRGAPIEKLTLVAQRIRSLEPLRGMSLVYPKYCGGLAEGLSPLEGMPITSLRVEATPVADLGPLKGMPLTFLFIARNGVSDITVLRGMPIETLHMESTKVTDLTPLAELPLVTLSFSPHKVTKGIEVLRGMRPLRSIGPSCSELMPAAEFWKKYDAGEFR